MSSTQIKGNQIQDGTITSSDIDDSLEKDFTKSRTTTNDSTPGFLNSKIVAGDNVSISIVGVSGSNQTLVISSSGSLSSQGNDFFSSAHDGSIYATGSLALVGNDSINSARDVGSDVFFYVSGTVGGSQQSVSLFGGDVSVSGSLSVANGATIVGNSITTNDSAILGNLNVVLDANVDGALYSNTLSVGSGGVSVVGSSVVTDDSAFLGNLSVMSDVDVAGTFNAETVYVGSGGIFITGSVVLSQGQSHNLGQGTITQSTGLSSDVTINSSSGVITTVSANTAAGSSTTFTVNNNTVSSSSIVVVSVGDYSGTIGTNGIPVLHVDSISSGTFVIRIINCHASNALNGTLKIKFIVA